MRNGTKIGLALIALAWLTASSAVSAHFIAKAQSQGERLKINLTNPRGCVCVPADVRSQGGLWV